MNRTIGLALMMFALSEVARADFVSTTIGPDDLGGPKHGLTFRFQSSERVEGSDSRIFTFIIQAETADDVSKLRDSDVQILRYRSNSNESWQISPQLDEIEGGIRFNFMASQEAAKLFEISVMLPDRTIYDSLFWLRVSDFWDLGLGEFGASDRAQQAEALKP